MQRLGIDETFHINMEFEPAPDKSERIPGGHGEWSGIENAPSPGNDGHIDPHEKPVELGLGQWKCPGLFQGILGGDHVKRFIEETGGPLHRNLAFFHGLQQRALSFWVWPG